MMAPTRQLPARHPAPRPKQTLEASLTPGPSPTIPITVLALVMAPSATPLPEIAATSATMPEDLIIAPAPSPTPLTVAAVPTQVLVQTSSIAPGRGPSQWLILALVLQAGLLLAAGVEFVRRSRRRR